MASHGEMCNVSVVIMHELYCLSAGEMVRYHRLYKHPVQKDDQTSLRSPFDDGDKLLDEYLLDEELPNEKIIGERAMVAGRSQLAC